MSFWDNAQPLMEKKGIRRTDIAKATGKTRSAVSDWIKRKVYPSADDAVKIAEQLGVSVHYLVTGQDNSGLSAMEKKLLEVCRGLTDSQIHTIINVIKEMKLGWYQEKGDSHELDLVAK